MIKDKHDLNQEKLLELKEQLLNKQEEQSDSNKSNSKANPKYDPKQFNFEQYSYGDYETGELVFDDEESESNNKQVNNEGLSYPSIDNLLEVVDSKYKLAYIAAKRAKIIKPGTFRNI